MTGKNDCSVFSAREPLPARMADMGAGAGKARQCLNLPVKSLAHDIVKRFATENPQQQPAQQERGHKAHAENNPEIRAKEHKNKNILNRGMADHQEGADKKNITAAERASVRLAQENTRTIGDKIGRASCRERV